jgi:hypothetical protein
MVLVGHSNALLKFTTVEGFIFAAIHHVVSLQAHHLKSDRCATCNRDNGFSDGRLPG